MKQSLLLIPLLFSVPSFARSLDGARVLAARIEARLPGFTGKLLCPSCDDQWGEGSEAVNTLERVLASVADDPRLVALADGEDLGALISEHFGRAVNDGRSNRPSTGHKSLCGLSRPPCELFTPSLFKEYCDLVDHH